jgi:hypothetical protein
MARRIVHMQRNIVVMERSQELDSLGPAFCKLFPLFDLMFWPTIDSVNGNLHPNL